MRRPPLGFTLIELLVVILLAGGQAVSPSTPGGASRRRSVPCVL